MKRRVFEANTLFDTADGTLRGKGWLLRVREAGPSGALTYKGAEIEGKYKDREELEVKLSDPRTLCDILGRLELIPAFRYEKYRTEYGRAGEKGVATLDETPIGAYLELEGTPAWIDRNARRLGFSDADYSTASYYGLYVDYCREHGLPVTNMIFPAAESGSGGQKAG